MRGDDALIAPAAQMGEEAVGKGRGGLALVRLVLAFGEPIEPATIKVDEASVGPRCIEAVKIAPDREPV